MTKFSTISYVEFYGRSGIESTAQKQGLKHVTQRYACYRKSDEHFYLCYTHIFNGPPQYLNLLYNMSKRGKFLSTTAWEPLRLRQNFRPVSFSCLDGEAKGSLKGMEVSLMNTSFYFTFTFFKDLISVQYKMSIRGTFLSARDNLPSLVFLRNTEQTFPEHDE